MTERDRFDCGRCYQLRVERDRANLKLSAARDELEKANRAVAEAGVVNPGEPLEARIWTLGMTIRTLRGALNDGAVSLAEDAGYWRQKYEERMTLEASDEATIRADERERWKQSHGGLVGEIERETRARTVAEVVASLQAVAGVEHTARSLVDHITREFGYSR